jgi:hypothetical protein
LPVHTFAFTPIQTMYILVKIVEDCAYRDNSIAVVISECVSVSSHVNTTICLALINFSTIYVHTISQPLPKHHSHSNNYRARVPLDFCCVSCCNRNVVAARIVTAHFHIRQKVLKVRTLQVHLRQPTAICEKSQHGPWKFHAKYTGLSRQKLIEHHAFPSHS